MLCSVVLCLTSVYLPASVQGKGSGGSAGVGGFSASSANSATAATATATSKTSGNSWSGSGVSRTASGSGLVYSNGRPASNVPRMYKGSQRGPRHLTSRARMLVASGVALLWVAGPPRYGFYSRKHDCQDGHFRFGGSCRVCSDGPCPIGQYRVPCTGGSDSYCARCSNSCLKFNDSPPTTSSDDPPIAVCLEDFLGPVTANSSHPDACDPNRQPSRCAYSSEGSIEKSAGLSLCQIERCCPACESDEEAIEKGFGIVCDGSVPTAEAFENRDPSQRPDNVDLVFNLETPGCVGDFNVNAPEYKAAIPARPGPSAQG